MKRTDLIALAELLAAGTITGSESRRLADFLRQIAESQPVAWRFEVRGMIRGGMTDWRHYKTTRSQEAALASVERCGDGIEGRAVPLYTLPLDGDSNDT